MGDIYQVGERARREARRYVAKALANDVIVRIMHSSPEFQASPVRMYDLFGTVVQEELDRITDTLRADTLEIMLERYPSIWEAIGESPDVDS